MPLYLYEILEQAKAIYWEARESDWEGAGQCEVSGAQRELWVTQVLLTSVPFLFSSVIFDLSYCGCFFGHLQSEEYLLN